ncbi:hypothetical protein PI87_27900 [Ralstonia sp. A12]|nr:hypothetical protein PI87_27900 [Ralstonia sp. A12]
MTDDAAVSVGADKTCPQALADCRDQRHAISRSFPTKYGKHDIAATSLCRALVKLLQGPEVKHREAELVERFGDGRDGFR